MHVSQPEPYDEGRKSDYNEITKRTAQLADKLGFDSLWLNDHVLAPADPTDKKFQEAWSSLAALAVLTARLKVGRLWLAMDSEPGTPSQDGCVTRSNPVGGRLIPAVAPSIERRDRKTLLRTIRGYALAIKLAQIDT